MTIIDYDLYMCWRGHFGDLLYPQINIILTQSAPAVCYPYTEQSVPCFRRTPYFLINFPGVCFAGSIYELDSAFPIGSMSKKCIKLVCWKCLYLWSFQACRIAVLYDHGFCSEGEAPMIWFSLFPAIGYCPSSVRTLLQTVASGSSYELCLVFACWARERNPILN